MSDANDRYLGRTIHDRYHLIEQIGVGAFGSVYRARDFKTDQDCAVKLLHVSAAESAQVSSRFWDEARYVAELCHPNVVESYDYGTDSDGTLFLCMELLRGRDLGMMLVETPKLTVELTLHIVRQIGSALHAVHQASIVHRDLKPKNIFLVDGGGNGPPLVKVIDFGLAKYLGAWARDRGSAGLLIGTPDYLPPESWSGNSSEIDSRADQWSLAVLAYRMLTGRLPFFGHGDMLRVRHAVLECTPPPVRQLEPSLPAHIELALSRALSKDKEQRFRDIRDFLRALHNRAPLPPVADPPPAPAPGLREAAAPELPLCRRNTQPLPYVPLLAGPIASHTTVVLPAPRPRMMLASTLSQALASTLARPLPGLGRRSLHSLRAPRRALLIGTLLVAVLGAGVCGSIVLRRLAAPASLPAVSAPAPAPPLQRRVRSALRAAYAAWEAPPAGEASAHAPPAGEPGQSPALLAQPALLPTPPSGAGAGSGSDLGAKAEDPAAAPDTAASSGSGATETSEVARASHSSHGKRSRMAAAAETEIAAPGSLPIQLHIRHADYRDERRGERLQQLGKYSPNIKTKTRYSDLGPVSAPRSTSIARRAVGRP